MTIAELKSLRAAAGEAYAAALNELHARYVDLAALDAALKNDNVGLLETKTFPEIFDSAPWPLCHGEFAPRTNSPNWRDEVYARRDEYLRSFHQE